MSLFSRNKQWSIVILFNVIWHVVAVLLSRHCDGESADLILKIISPMFPLVCVIVVLDSLIRNHNNKVDLIKILLLVFIPFLLTSIYTYFELENYPPLF